MPRVSLAEHRVLSRCVGFAGMVVVLVGAAASSASSELKTPFDVEGQRLLFGERVERSYCHSTPEPVVDLVKEKGEIETRVKEAIVSFQRNINDITDAYVRSQPANPTLAACALEWLASWAEANAMLGTVDNGGQFLRKWALVPIAVGYLKIVKATGLDRTRADAVEDWIRRWGRAVRDDWSNNVDAASRSNFQLYWAGWGVMAAAIACGDRELFRWSIDVARFAMKQVQQDGSLGWAMEGGRKALYHHLVAVAPLVMIAEGAAANGYDLYGEECGALRRLARFALAGIDSPSTIATRAGAPQTSALPPDSEDLAWLIPYARHFPQDVSEKWLRSYKNFDNRLLGGDMLLLFGRVRTTVAAG